MTTSEREPEIETRPEGTTAVVEAREAALKAIQDERTRQSTKWDLEHDLEHTDEDWTTLITWYANRAKWAEVGALALAALEANRA